MVLFLAALALVIVTWPPRQLDCGVKKTFLLLFCRKSSFGF
jgi:hypothetical protein